MSKALREVQKQAGMSTYKGNRGYSTQYSSVNNGAVTMDPSIRRLQDDALQRTNALYGDVGKASSDYIGQLGTLGKRYEGTTADYVKGQRGLRSQYEGNNAGYIQARVNPILQQSALRKGELTRSHGMRNMSGSSFANQDFNNLSMDTSRAVGDATALGTRENLDTMRSIDADVYGAETGNLDTQKGIAGDQYASVRDRIASQYTMNGQSLDVAKDRLQQELAAMGLSKEQIQQEMTMFEEEQKRRNSTNQSIGESMAGMWTIGGGGGSG